MHSHPEPALGVKLKCPTDKISDHIAVTNQDVHRGLLLTRLRPKTWHWSLLSVIYFSPVDIFPEGRLYPGSLLVEVAGVGCPLCTGGLRGTGGALPEEVTRGVADVPGQVGQDDVGRLRGAGHGRLDQVEVGLVSHLLAVIIQLLEILGIQRRQSLASVLCLSSPQLGQISLLVPSTLTLNMATHCSNVPLLRMVSGITDPCIQIFM